MRSATVIIAALSMLVAAPVVANQTGPPVLTRLALELSTNKTVYLPGELVELRFRLSPRSGPAVAPAGMSVADGSLALFVRHSPEDYLEYQGPGWHVKRTTHLGTVMLSVDEAVESSGTLLYNEVPPTGHLSPMYAKAELEGRIPSEYALPRAGSFSLKAVYRGAYSDAHLESTPVRIVVTEPTGEDLQVWQILQRNPRLGYVLQTGTLPDAATDSDEDNVLAMLTDIVTSHSSSTYASQVRNGLARFERAVAARRRQNARAR